MSATIGAGTARVRGAVKATEPGDLLVASWTEGARLLERTRRQAKNAEADYVRAGGTLTSSCAKPGSVVQIASATRPLKQQAPSPLPALGQGVERNGGPLRTRKAKA